MMERHYPDSAALCRAVKEISPTVLLSFSAGKDALASWVQLRDHGFDVRPFFLYLVPGLEFVEEGLRMYEQAFGAEVLRLPHPSLPRMLKNEVFQPPDRARPLRPFRRAQLSYVDVEAAARKRFDLPATSYVAIGTRMADSPNRRTATRRYGALNPTRRSFQPVYDWRLDDVLRAIARAGLRLTVDYELFGRSFDGIDYRFLHRIRERFPRDYQRILEWFPLAHLELQRRTLCPKGN